MKYLALIEHDPNKHESLKTLLTVEPGTFPWAMVQLCKGKTVRVPTKKDSRFTTKFSMLDMSESFVFTKDMIESKQWSILPHFEDKKEMGRE